MWWWHALQHWLAIHTGTTGESGPYYGFFSGFGSDLGEATLIGALLAVCKKHNCHTRWCWRVGHHDFTDEMSGITYRLCRRHHPAHPGWQLRKEHIAVIRERNEGGGDDPES